MCRKTSFILGVLFFVSASYAAALQQFAEEESLNTFSKTSTLQEETARTLHPINSRISSIQLMHSLANAPKTAAVSHETGLSAGDNLLGINAWGNAIYTDFEDDTAGAAYDGNGISVSIGADKSLLDGKLVSGLSFSYDTSETSDNSSGKTDTDSFTISPYASYMFNDTYGADFSFGWGKGDTDIQRYNWLNQKNSGSQDSDHAFYSLGVSGNHWLQYINLSWRLGYYYSKTNSDAYTETNVTDGSTTSIPKSSNKIGQVSASIQAGYYLQTWMPYAKLTYENETIRTRTTSSNDDDGFVWEAGANIFTTGALSGGASLSLKTGRSHYDSLSGMARLSYAF